jgi:drug/metabolite transporter (DMT)-like permease
MIEFLKSPHARLFGGAILISFSPVWVALVSVSPTTSGFYRMSIGAVMLALFVLFTRRRLAFSRRTWAILLVAAVFFAFDLYFWHRSIVYIGPGLATLLANFQVFIMMLAGFVLLRQKPRMVQVIAAPLALVGLGMAVGLDWQDLSAEYRLGVWLGLLTAVAYAGYMLTMRAARTGSDDRMPLREVAVVSAVCAVFLAFTVVGEGGSFAIPTWSDAAWLLGYGILSHSIGWSLIASSLTQVSTSQAGLALLLQPTLSYIWDVLLFNRSMQPIEFAGAAMASAAIAVTATVKLRVKPRTRTRFARVEPRHRDGTAPAPTQK